jgi:outer membrane protein assembly factor BamB
MTLTVLAAAIGPAQEWTRFRGPNGTGISGDNSLPAQWTDADYRWKTRLPGQGHSSPVLWGERLFLLSADPATAMRYVLCLSTTDGRELWRREFPSEPHKLSPRNTFATSTPTVDAERLYVSWSTPAAITLMALDHEGRDVWKRDLGKWVSQHGWGASPILCDGLVVVHNSQDTQELDPGVAPGDSSISAFDARTGAHRWTTPLVASRACYSVPCIYQTPGGKPELLFITTSEGVFTLDPQTGKEHWRVPGVFKMRVVCSPLLAGDLVFGSTGSGGGGNCLTAVRVSPPRGTAYTMKNNASYVPSAVAKDDMLFVFADKGFVSCVDLQTGAAHWRERLGSGFSGSPVIAGDKLYCINDEGIVYVVAAAKQFQRLGENRLGEPSRSTPAIAGGRLYLRTLTQLFCVSGTREVGK